MRRRSKQVSSRQARRCRCRHPENGGRVRSRWQARQARQASVQAVGTAETTREEGWGQLQSPRQTPWSDFCNLAHALLCYHRLSLPFSFSQPIEPFPGSLARKGALCGQPSMVRELVRSLEFGADSRVFLQDCSLSCPSPHDKRRCRRRCARPGTALGNQRQLPRRTR